MEAAGQIRMLTTPRSAPADIAARRTAAPTVAIILTAGLFRGNQSQGRFPLNSATFSPFLPPDHDCRLCDHSRGPSRSGDDAEDVVADDQARLHERVERGVEMAGDRGEQVQLAEVARAANQPLEDR